MSNFFIVIDNNILISRLLLPNSLPAAAVRRALNEGIILISEEILLELTDVFTRKKFDKYVSLSEKLDVTRCQSCGGYRVNDANVQVENFKALRYPQTSKNR